MLELAGSDKTVKWICVELADRRERAPPARLLGAKFFAGRRSTPEPASAVESPAIRAALARARRRGAAAAAVPGDGCPERFSRHRWSVYDASNTDATAGIVGIHYRHNRWPAAGTWKPSRRAAPARCSFLHIITAAERGAALRRTPLPPSPGSRRLSAFNPSFARFGTPGSPAARRSRGRPPWPGSGRGRR